MLASLADEPSHCDEGDGEELLQAITDQLGSLPVMIVLEKVYGYIFLILGQMSTPGWGGGYYTSLENTSPKCRR